VSRKTIIAIAAAVGVVIVLVIGVRLSRTDYAAAAWFTTFLFLIADGLVALHFLLGGGANAIRRAALISVLVTVALIGNCSATGVAGGSATIAADPGSYLLTLLILAGPVLLVLAAPGFITLTSLTSRTERWILVAAVIGAIAAPLTAFGALVLSYAVLCPPDPTPAQSAECVASSGSLASIFGVVGPAMVLPPLSALMRRRVGATVQGSAGAEILKP
jgi:hypothetical protein